MITQPELEDDL